MFSAYHMQKHGTQLTKAKLQLLRPQELSSKRMMWSGKASRREHSSPPPAPYPAQLVGSQVPDQGLNLGPCHWKRRVLNTGWPGNAQGGGILKGGTLVWNISPYYLCSLCADPWGHYLFPTWSAGACIVPPLPGLPHLPLIPPSSPRGESTNHKWRWKL